MYNEEKKLAWMEDAERRNALAQRRVVLAHLNRLEEAVESRLNADVYDLICSGRKSDVINYGDAYLGFTTYSTVRRFVQTVNAYIDWRFAVDAGAIPSPSQRFSTYEFSLVKCFSGPLFIKDEDQLAAELSHHRVEDGDLLPVFASLAWLDYSPTNMIELQQDNVDDTGAHIVIEGIKVQDGFVNDTLLYYSRTKLYNKPAFQQQCIKEDGPEFVRNIVVINNRRQRINMLTRIRDLACKTELLSGGTIVYSQLNQAGRFQRWLDLERNGVTVDMQWVQATQKVNALTAKERAQEFEDFKIALRA